MWTLLGSWLVSAPAHAIGGSFATGPGLDPPASTATQVAVIRANGRTVVTLTAQVAEDLGRYALLWPAPGYVQGSVSQPFPVGLEQIERWTQPRVEAIACEELVDVVRYPTPPGCATYDVTLAEPPGVGEAATEVIELDAEIETTPLTDLSVIDPADLDSWLADRNLGLTGPVQAGLQPFLDAGVPLIALFSTDLVPEGDWLPPIRYEVVGDTLELPVAPWATEARTDHELTIFTLHDDLEADAEITNFPQDVVTDDCQIPEGTTTEDWWSREIQRFRAADEIPWVAVHTGSAETCAPCTSDPLDAEGLADLGASGLPLGSSRTGRYLIRYAPGQLVDNPVLAFTAPAEDNDTRWVEAANGLSFVFPICRQDPDPLDVCPGVQTEATRGCASSAPPWSWGLLSLAALWFMRRRKAAWFATAGLLAISVPAHAIDDGFLDKRPVFEVAASAGVVGTDRVRIDITGAPASAPLLGVHGRWAFFGWKDGANVGLTASLRGFTARPEPAGDETPIRFTLFEPSVGIDVRHGRLLDSGVSPFFRYGAKLVAPVLDPNSSAAQVTVSGLVHVGAGLWLGKPERNQPWWPFAEARVSVVPRTDGLVTTYNTALDLPGFAFFPGTANLQLLVGVGFR